MLLLSVLVACSGGGAYTYAGVQTDQYFNAVGVGVSTYANEDQTAVPDDLKVTQVLPSTVVDGREVVTLEQYLDDGNNTFLGGVQWATVPGLDTQIVAWAGPDATYIPFDPPIQVTDLTGYMYPGDSVTTETGGTTYTSTFVNEEDCPVLWTTDVWEDCFHLQIDDGGGAVSSNDAATRPIFVGEYWLVTRFFIAWQHTTGYDAKWNLSNFNEPAAK